jgi:cobalt/nickel transport system permease protein
MIEWLKGDPLNGIVISITFCISLILGRMIRNSAEGKTIDQRTKVLLSFFLIISVTLMRHWYIPIFISAICLFFAIKHNVTKNYINKLIFPVILTFFILLIQTFSYGMNALSFGNGPIYEESFFFGLMIFSRVIASASILILLIVTTSEAELLETMSWLKLPATIIEISSLMKRYIKTFSIEGTKLRMAQDSRCGFSERLGFVGRMKNTASISGALILRAFSRSNDVYRAMLSRGWKQGSQYHIEFAPLKRYDILIGIVFFSTVTGLVFLDRFL